MNDSICFPSTSTITVPLILRPYLLMVQLSFPVDFCVHGQNRTFNDDFVFHQTFNELSFYPQQLFDPRFVQQ